MIQTARLCLLGCGFLVLGCAQNQPDLASYAEPESGPLLITTELNIDRERGAARYSIRNESRRDVVCSSVTVRSVFDDPDTYLERGETVTAMSNAFVRRDESIEGAVGVPGGSAKDTQIRTVSLFEAGQNCSAADVEGYCDHADKSDSERAFLAKLFLSAGAGTCADLSERLESFRTLDFSGWGEIEARPIVYLSRVLVIVADDTPGNREIREQYAGMRAARFAPTFILRGAQSADASVGGRVWREIRYFLGIGEWCCERPGAGRG